MTPTTIHGGDSSISTIHPDILRTHILTRLDGPTLASVACTSTELNSLASQEYLWSEICSSTWPSTNTPRMRQVISNFPNGHRSFFSASFPNVASTSTTPPLNPHRPSNLISAVDIFYRDQLIFSKVVETETESGWFNFSPFRVDMLYPKDTCQTLIRTADAEDACRDLELSWIIVDHVGGRAVNLSSLRPVSVQRHWLSGEVHARFSVVLGGERGSSSELVHCAVLVTCGGKQVNGMHLREVSLQVEDLDGMYLNGKDSLGILSIALEGKKGIVGRKGEEGRKRYEEFLERKRERKEKKLRIEETLDMLCVVFGILTFVSLGLFLFWV